MVSHDRQLISNSCNRFWLIDENGLSEWQDADEVYEQLRHRISPDAPRTTAKPEAKITSEADDLLERLIELEWRLAEDLARKPKHQKPQLQQRWREEIATINNQLV